MAIFPTFFFGQCRPGKCLVWYSRTKNAFLGYKKKKFNKSKNSYFSKGVNAPFWSRNGNFFQLFFLGNINKENVFSDILERKNTFLGYKNKKFKTWKNWHFSKGANPSFLSKIGHFFKKKFSFWKYTTGKLFLWYSRTKKRLSIL